MIPSSLKLSLPHQSFLGWDTEENHGRNAEFAEGFRFGWKMVNGQLALAGHGCDGNSHVAAMSDEERVDKIGSRQSRFPHQAPN